jgi:hypothetical protein
MEVENMSDEIELDLGPLPPPTDQDTMWAWRLWNTLAIKSDDGAFHGLNTEGGIWDMPGVGRFRRTDATELTLTEIHAEQEPNRLGISVWNRLDWIVLLGAQIGWVVITDQVQKADNEEVSPDRDEPPMQHRGSVYACECGMAYSLLGPDPSGLRVKVSSDGDCLNPNCNIVVPYPHAGVLNSVDDRAVIAKMQAQEMIAIAHDEDEGPPPIPIPIDGDETPIPEILDTSEEE